MNILMVSPKFSDTFWSFKHALWFISKAAAFPPYGLLRVAALHPEYFNIRLVDMNVQKLKKQDLKWADFVEIGSMHTQFESEKEVIALCNHFGKPVIKGGPSLENEGSCKKFPGVTSFVIGKAEGVMNELISDLKSGQLKRIYASNGIVSIESLPIPRFDLVNPKYYGSGSVQFSVGCPHSCDYCSECVIDGKGWRQRDHGSCLLELEALYRAGFRGAVQICDANFAGNFAKVKSLLKKIIAWQIDHGYPFKFCVETTALVSRDEELLDLMVAAGITKDFLGLETANEECLKECNKLQNLGYDLSAASRKILKHGMLTFSGIMTGFDHDQETFADEQIDFIIKSRIGVAMVGAMQAQPGTALHARLEKEGRLIHEAVNNTDYRSNFWTVISPRNQEFGTRRIVETVSSPEICFQRICSIMEDLDVSKRPGKRVTLLDLWALVKSIIRLGIFGGSGMRGCYWRTLRTAWRVNRLAFPEAVTLLIYNWHLKKSEKR